MLKVVLHNRETPLDWVILWRVRNVHNAGDLQSLQLGSHHLRLMGCKVIHVKREGFTLTLLGQLDQEVDK
jgi:hypothetical protein